MLLRPSFAPTIYHDGQSLFLELPGSPGQTLRFPFTEGGLSKALRHIPNVTRQPGYLSGASNIRPKPFTHAEEHNYPPIERLVKVDKATRRKREKARFSDAMREAAGAVIRKLKVGE